MPAALRAGMIVTPAARGLEVSGPDAQTPLASCSLLAVVAVSRHGQPLGNHGGAKIATSHAAGGQQPSILIDIFGVTVRRTASQQRRHAITGCLAAGPATAVRIPAVLRQLGRIEAQEANAILAETETVTIADARPSGNRGWRLIKRCRDQRQHG